MEWLMMWTMLILFPLTSILPVRKLCCIVFENNEAMIKMVTKGRSPDNDTCFQKPPSCFLIGCSIQSIWTPKTKSNTLTPKNQVADILTKGNFTRDKWNHILCLFNISHFSSTNSLEAMSKRTQEDAGEGRVTAKSKPIMNVVSRWSERNPSVLASIASESPGKTRYESQILLSSWIEQHLRTEICKGHLFIKLLGMEYWRKIVFSRVEIWWSAGSKNGETCKWTTTRFVHRAHGQTYCWWLWYGLWHRRRIRNVVIIQIILAQGDRVRKMLDQSSKDATQDSNKHSVVWGMFITSTFTSICIHGKELFGKFTFHENYRWKSHSKADVLDIYKADIGTISWDFCLKSDWESSSWKQLYLVNDEEVHQSLECKGLCIPRICVMFWKDEREPTIKYCLGRQVDVVQEFIATLNLRTHLMVNQWISGGISSQDSPHCSLSMKSKTSCPKWAYNKKISLDGLSSCRCSTTSHGDLKTMNSNAN